MDEEWLQQYGDVHNEIGLAIASGDNQMVQHGHISDEMDGLLGDQSNIGAGYANAGAADQDNIDGQARSDRRTGSGHYRGRHSKEQIQQLEAAFRADANPDEKIRLALSRRTGLSVQQVQIWFQNRRSSGKSKAKQQETRVLKEENDRLKAEQKALESAQENNICLACRGEGTPELRALYAENLKLKDKHMRASAYLKTVSGGRAQVINGTIVLAGDDASVTEHPAPPPPSSHHAPLTAMDPMMFADNGIAHNNHETAGNTLVIQHAACALEEFKALVGLGEPMWSLAQDGEVEVINYHLYMETMFPGMSEHYQMKFSSDGTRKTGIITCTATDLVGVLMDAEWWRMMFPGIVASATTSKIITPGASRHGLIQMMTAELRVLSPRVPVRKINFVRQCQRLQPNIWAVVDVSIDGILEQDVAPSTYTACRLLPSGCYIEELDSGYCKVTWIVNMEHDGATVPPLHHPLFRSGWALGACRWLASLQRRCEYIAFLHSNPIPTLNNAAAITPEARRSILDLAHRMTTSFYQALCSPGSQPWSSEDEWYGYCGTGADRFKVAVRVVTFCSGSATVLRATTTVWLPGIPSERVFNYLCDKDRRIEWDIVANGATILQEGYFSTGQVQGNAVSLLRTIASNGTNNKLILQESCIDASCMVLAYAPIDEKYMHDVMNNGGRTSFTLVPSGLVVLPDGHTQPGVAPIPAVCSSSSATRHKTSAGSLVSSMYQTQLRGQPPENLSKAVADNVGNLICHAIKNIKSAVKANIVLAA